MTKDELIKALNYYGYDLVDISDRSPYNSRKCKTWGVRDRRNEQLVCAYSTMPQIEKWYKAAIVKA